eukprot:NODE_714_length_1395_cov_264.150000.p1 GENE.NODE_714_length_1395_cov_264.150000~~NODE_714_length_1395_cov_264.150000.p1  ORF type:complete len:325 (+),score=76.43 NODE_714_length_1395_cov_264.150000:219-1193(+)
MRRRRCASTAATTGRSIGRALRSSTWATSRTRSRPFDASRKSSASADARCARWLRKCDAELSGSSLPLDGIVAPMSAPAPAPVPAAAAPARPPSPQPAAAPAAPAAPAPADSGAPSVLGRKPLRHEWHQNNTHVFITVFAKGLSQEQCRIDFHEHNKVTLAMKLPDAEDEEYTLDFKLFDGVDPEQCKLEVSKVKVEVALAKKNSGVLWSSLEEPEASAAGGDALGLPAYPSSSKQKRDWGQVDRDCEAELKQSPSDDGALNKLFREIYEKADEETRRAMNKSFQTSGGTVLSTNWGEVGTADYEGKDRPTAPEGQEWRNWSAT